MGKSEIIWKVLKNKSYSYSFDILNIFDLYCSIVMVLSLAHINALSINLAPEVIETRDCFIVVKASKLICVLNNGCICQLYIALYCSVRCTVNLYCTCSVGCTVHLYYSVSCAMHCIL